MTAQYENPVVEYRNGLVGKWVQQDNQDGDGEEGPEVPKVTILLPHTKKLFFLL